MYDWADRFLIVLLSCAELWSMKVNRSWPTQDPFTTKRLLEEDWACLCSLKSWCSSPTSNMSAEVSANIFFSFYGWGKKNNLKKWCYFIFKTSKSFSNLRQGGVATSVHKVIKKWGMCCLWAKASKSHAMFLSARSLIWNVCVASWKSSCVIMART